MREPVVARCRCCGTQYTARAWPWLEPVGRGVDRRACPVPGCCTTVVRNVESVLFVDGSGGTTDGLTPSNDDGRATAKAAR